MPDETQPDVVIVGAGIGGGALAFSLADAGLSVVLLEKTQRHKDVVRGEWLAPWGVVEADTLGLLDTYANAGAHRLKRHTSYSDAARNGSAEIQSVDFTGMDVPEPLCLGHPTTYNLLNDMATQAGAVYLRGIQRLNVVPGSPPEVTFNHVGEQHHFKPRWVVGADGRNGVVAKQIGARISHDPEHHLFSGMLVEQAHDWPEDLQVIATEGDAHVLAFPQGQGRVRAYLGWPSSDRTRLIGPDGPANFLASWQLTNVPDADAISNATPASPCIAYPNYDTWLDRFVAEGVVLIGDAAGRNDPIIGQGLSITHRDVRQVRDALLNATSWSTEIFAPYVAERRERMQRLRTIARLTSIRDAAFGESGFQQRALIHERLHANPELATPFAGAFIGPDALPAEVFAPEFTSRLVDQDIWSPSL